MTWSAWEGVGRRGYFLAEGTARNSVAWLAGVGGGLGMAGGRGGRPKTQPEGGPGCTSRLPVGGRSLASCLSLSLFTFL